MRIERRGRGVIGVEEEECGIGKGKGRGRGKGGERVVGMVGKERGRDGGKRRVRVRLEEGGRGCRGEVGKELEV